MDRKRLSRILMEKCGIFYKKELLSDDEILSRYIKFLIDEFFTEKRRISFSLHTGSKCFDVLSIVIAALRCIMLEAELNKSSIPKFMEGDIVVYDNERFKWRGLETDPFQNNENKSYYVLQQDAKGKNGILIRYVPVEKGNFIIEASLFKSLVLNYNGQVPNDFNELVKLPGVGRKTANVVLAVGFKIPSIPVDTHVYRTSYRLGFRKSKDDLITCEEKLKRYLPQSKWIDAHHQLILFGREYCKSQNPQCENCPLKNYCVVNKNDRRKISRIIEK